MELYNNTLNIKDIKNDIFIHDNRFMTSYYNSRAVDQNIQTKNLINTISDYKIFLQRNSINLINNDRTLLNNITKIGIINRNNNINRNNDINYINN